MSLWCDVVCDRVVALGCLCLQSTEEKNQHKDRHKNTERRIDGGWKVKSESEQSGLDVYTNEHCGLISCRRVGHAALL